MKYVSACARQVNHICRSVEKVEEETHKRLGRERERRKGEERRERSNNAADEENGSGRKERVESTGEDGDGGEVEKAHKVHGKK